MDGKRHGQGRLTSIADGVVLHEGSFRDDVPIQSGWQPRPKYLDTSAGNEFATADQSEELEAAEREQEAIPFKIGGNFGL